MRCNAQNMIYTQIVVSIYFWFEMIQQERKQESVIYMLTLSL